jgi:hypothetical protein
MNFVFKLGCYPKILHYMYVNIPRFKTSQNLKHFLSQTFWIRIFNLYCNIALDISGQADTIPFQALVLNLGVILSPRDI